MHITLHHTYLYLQIRQTSNAIVERKFMQGQETLSKWRDKMKSFRFIEQNDHRVMFV